MQPPPGHLDIRSLVTTTQCSSTGLDTCTQIGQFNKFEQHYYQLVRQQPEFIKANTSCLFPCTYLEYQVAATRAMTFQQYGLWISFGSTTTTVRKEFYILNFETFVSNYGGSLGLFVGFSFFMMWDIAKDLAAVVWKISALK